MAKGAINLTFDRNQMLPLQIGFIEKIVEALPVAVFAKNVKDNYRFVLWNAMAEQVLGISRSQILGKTDYDNFSQREADYFRETDEMVMRSRTPLDIPCEKITTASGEWMLHTRKVPVYDDNGEPFILLGILEDITDMRKSEEKIQKFSEEMKAKNTELANAIVQAEEARAEAEHANNAKSDFLAHMSHELRTPLHCILGMSQLLLDNEKRPEQYELADSIYQSSCNLLEIVNDILDLSKIEANEIFLESIGFDLSKLVMRIVESLSPLASRKGITLSYVLPKPALPYVLGDPTRIGRVLTNLVSNAIKYTDDGHVTVEIMDIDVEPGSIHILFQVVDTGIGIPKDKLDLIFEKFTQADSSTTRRYGGTGLGLSICKQLVSMMGGTIGVDSEPNKGSTFWFRLPLTITDTLHPEMEGNWLNELQENSLTPQLTAEEIRILVAEDHPLSRLFIDKVLRQLGIQHFEIVENGAEVLEVMQVRKFDLILMDCHMPVKNGYQATHLIREVEEAVGEGRVPIIAMTASAMRGDRERCFTAGMDAYVSKPVTMHELKRTLSRWIRFGINPDKEDSANENIIDLKRLEELGGGDKEMERNAATVFLKQSHTNLKDMEKSLVEDDMKTWTEAAHQLKGGALTMGANRLVILASNAHEDGPINKTYQQLSLKKIRNELGKIEAFLAQAGLLEN